MNEQTSTNTGLSTTAGDTIWINIWRYRPTGVEYRGIYDFKSPEEAAAAARQYLMDYPGIQANHIGVMPRDEWMGD